MSNSGPFDTELNAAFEELLDEYLRGASDPSALVSSAKSDEGRFDAEERINPAAEKTAIQQFLQTSCGCGQDCQTQFSAEEVTDARRNFRLLSWEERNSSILFQLRAFSRGSEFSESARTTWVRQRQKFEYRINVDRPVCRDAFLFFHGETAKRLKRLQAHLLEHGTIPPVHGNAGRKPVHACPEQDRDLIRAFIVNYADSHGLPDPGRDLRKGNGRLRILLPSVMSYISVHRIYDKSMRRAGSCPVGYRTFVRTWQQLLPHIVFGDPRTDLCIVCEEFKKELNRTAAMLDEQKEAQQAQVYKEALAHLRLAQQERTFYRARTKMAKQHYKKLVANQPERPAQIKASSRNMVAHYSWDFAQQLHYPFENQQVGPIYFKTPRRAQLFGVCNEGVPRQINYLIDEADFPGKTANTVISLVDHFFAHHGLGEKTAYLTADNCVAQNKNNAMLQYLMYRVLTGLHDRIELSFLVVGHTKFSPDGYFGLIRKRYRRSNVYTYDDLVDTINQSSQGRHNLCQRYTASVASKRPRIVYRDWVSWLAKHFTNIPGITGYRHFQIDHRERGIVGLKETAEGETTEVNLLSGKFPYSRRNRPARLPNKVLPPGLSEERQHYLYKHIREHIPDLRDKDQTCPKPDN